MPFMTMPFSFITMFPAVDNNDTVWLHKIIRFQNIWNVHTCTWLNNRMNRHIQCMHFGVLLNDCLTIYYWHDWMGFPGCLTLLKRITNEKSVTSTFSNAKFLKKRLQKISCSFILWLKTNQPLCAKCPSMNI